MGAVVNVKGENGRRISVTVRGYERAAGSDPYDYNWLSSSVLVEVDGFKGELDVAFQTFDFTRFGRELDALLDSKSKLAALVTMEEAVSLQVEVGSLGHATVTGILSSETVRLSFSFETDQTYLQAVQRELHALAREFPER
jgi:hypothetical protein